MNAADAVASVAAAFDAAGLHFGHGTDNAGDEAMWLFAHLQKIDYASDDWQARLSTALARPLGEPVAQAFGALARERIERRRPLAYLLGEAWFAGLRFEVNDQVLVPRSPIAELILSGFAPWVDAASVGALLEIGTGSGCLAVLAAKQFPEARVDATDVSAAALEVAARNAQRHGVADRLNLIEADLFDSPALGRYAVVFSNPPYVDASDMAARPAEFRHEPSLALAAGRDGLDLVRRMLVEAAAHLEPGGLLFCEVGNSAEALQRDFAEVPFTWLDFEHGGHGVFAITREQLDEHHAAFAARLRG